MSDHQADVDLDFADRNDILEKIRHIPARKLLMGKPEKHLSGVYVQPIPVDPAVGAATLHFKEADKRGYFKLDFLNVSVYQSITNEAHYQKLLTTTPPWERLADPKFVEQIIHIANFSKQIADCMPDTVPRMAMFLAAVRPSKKHLLGTEWKEMAKTIWEKVDDDEYAFKKSHAIAYATLVTLHMNLIAEEEATQHV